MPGAQVDTSIYQNAGNPLDTVSKFAGLQNLMNQNRLFQQQYQSNLAASQLFKDAVDPASGQLDVNKFKSMLSGNPGLSYGVGPVIEQSQKMQGQQLGIEQSKIDLFRKRQGAWSSVLGSLMANPNPSRQDVMQGAASLVNNGFSAAEVVAKLTDPNDPLPGDPAGIKDWLTRHYTQGLSEQGQYNAVLGSPTTINTGGQTRVIAASPLGGTRDLGTITNTMAPGEAASQVAIIGPDKRTYYVTKQQFADMTSGGPASPGTGTSPTTSAAVPFRNIGGPGGAGSPVSAAGGGETEGGTGSPIGGAPVAALAPGESEAMKEAGGESGRALANLRNDVGQSAQRVFILNKALSGLKNSSTGPGTDTMHTIYSFLAAQSPGNLGRYLPGVDINSIKSYDEAKKYLTQYAMNQAGALGQGTDEKLATALTGNASTSISNLAAQDVVKANIALERMKQAQEAAFDKSGQGPENFSQWAAGWNRTVDPRAFAIDMMTPMARADLIRGMKAGERSKFLDSVRAAMDAGIIKLGDLNGAK